MNEPYSFSGATSVPEPLGIGREQSQAPRLHPQPYSAVPSWLTPARQFILDLDGTLIHQRVLANGAKDLLSRLQGRYVVVSNNSTDTATVLARKLKRMGLPVEARHLVLAGEQTIDLLARDYAGARIRLLASPVIRHYARCLNCHLVDRDPDIVVLARDKTFTYVKLGIVVNEIRRGARLIVTNPDVSHPSYDTGLVPETGALMAAVLACSGAQPSAVIGKPGDVLFREALARLQSRPADTVVIGDNPDTDALGAARLGMGYLLVGNSAQAQALTPEQLLQTDCEAVFTNPRQLTQVDLRNC